MHFIHVREHIAQPPSGIILRSCIHEEDATRVLLEIEEDDDDFNVYKGVAEGSSQSKKSMEFRRLEWLEIYCLMISSIIHTK